MPRFHSLLLRPVALAATLLSLAATAQAPADVRVALVIGNSAYAGPAALVNPANDARAMSMTLRSLGFNVVEARDAGKEAMEEAITKVRDTLRGKQGVGMFYYAGHGLQLDWRNYMVPVDARIATAADVQQRAVDVSRVIDAFKSAGNRLNIVVLDACRDNPFEGTGSGKGLAQLDAPPGTFLAYATAPGNVAEDGAGQSNGLYTGFLVNELAKPVTKIEDVFKRVRLSVRKASNGRQIPWESTSLEEDFYFNDGQRFTLKPEELERMAQEARQKEQALMQQAAAARQREQQLAQEQERERQRAAAAAQIAQAEERARAQAEAQAREQQIALAREQERRRAEEAARQAEQTRQAEAQRQMELARARAEAEEAARVRLSAEQAREKAFNEQKADWDRIKDSTQVEDLYAFLRKYPSGGISELALARLERLDKAKIRIQADKSGQVQEYAMRRFVLGDVYEFATRDGLTGRSLQPWVSRVIKVDDEGAELATVRFGQPEVTSRHLHDGSSVDDPFGSYDPPYLGMPATDFQIGKKWRSRAIFTDRRTREKGWVEVEGKIVARENVTVPAGTFDSYKLEVNFVYQSGLRRKALLWSTPTDGMAIKMIHEARNRSGPPDVLIRELVRRSKA